jgi:phosphoribosyl-ATP pyrophosphohydrolase/phosphoribosyl-AMP cyclohydrolase
MPGQLRKQQRLLVPAEWIGLSLLVLRLTEPAVAKLGFMATLEQIAAQRLSESPEGSYTTSLVREGPHRLAQKVGEEALEVALAASGPADELLSEAADLAFHLIVLLRARGLTPADVTRTLEVRHEMRDGVHR